MLADAHRAHGLPYAALRYFNVAGADPNGRCGQATPEATHLIKVACEAVVGKRQGLAIFGTDYPTPDGTCVRDYVHVVDLADAHVLALQRLLHRGGSLVANVGYGHGYSVREVVRAVESVAGSVLPVTVADRRTGDPARLVADSTHLQKELGWQPRYDDLETIVAHALAWERQLAARG